MGTYEVSEIEVVETTIKHTDRVLELGCCIGVVAMCAAKRVQADCVTSVEANPLLIPSIKKNAELNNLRINIINGFVGNGSGKRDFYIGTSILGSSATKRKRSRHIEVPIVDFQELLLKIQPTYLIVDIEGEEINVLGHVKKGQVERICVETHPDLTVCDIKFDRCIKMQWFFLK